MARLDNVWQRVARFHPSVVRVSAGNAGYGSRRGYAVPGNCSAIAGAMAPSAEVVPMNKRFIRID